MYAAMNSATAAQAAVVSATAARANAATALGLSMPAARAAEASETALSAAYERTTAAVAAQSAVVQAGSAVAYEQQVRINFLTLAEREQAAALAVLTEGTLAKNVVQTAEFDAQMALTASTTAATVATGALTEAELVQQKAAGASMAAELELSAARKTAMSTAGSSLLKSVVPMAGLFAAVDGYKNMSESADNAGKAVGGATEMILGGAAAGFAFGGAAGAAIGAVVGLGVSVWSYQKAINAANKDTTLAQKALQDYGVEANLASLALAGVTNAQLDAVGGTNGLVDAMKSGKFPEFLVTTKANADALRAQADAAMAANKATLDMINGEMPQYNNEGVARYTDAERDQALAAEDLKAKSEALDGALKSITDNSKSFVAGSAQITTSQYEQAYAADMQTGALGSMTKAAWDAVVAQGGLGAEATTAALRMEGLAGTAGYVTQMITGIPVGTQINFGTNAMEVAKQIAVLMATQDALYASMGKPGADNLNGRTNSLSSRIAALDAQLASALTAPVTTLSLPSLDKAPKSGGQSAASKAADAAAQAAKDAAQKLASDQKAQVQFGDAFGTIMESALAGNFDEYRKKLQDEITSLTRDGYTAAADTLSRMSTALTTASLDYSVLTNKLKAASTAYDDLTGKMKDQYNTSRDLIAGLGKATDAQSFDQLAYLLGETTSKALDYQAVLTQLTDKGLSTDLWNQLAQAGPESAGLAQSILDQGQSGIDQLNTLSTGLLGAADTMGTLVSDSMYQQGVNAMQAYIDGLKSGSAALEAQLQTIANNVLNQTAGAITPGNAGYSQVSTAPTQVVNTFSVSVDAKSLGDIKSVQDFIAMLEQAKTTDLVNQAGTVTS
jgi:hypothetical protein